MSVDRAVLWDMDRTLIDSEEFHWISWRDTLATEGVAITHEQFLASFGQRNDSILPRWLGAEAACEKEANFATDLLLHLRNEANPGRPGATFTAFAKRSQFRAPSAGSILRNEANPGSPWSRVHSFCERSQFRAPTAGSILRNEANPGSPWSRVHSFCERSQFPAPTAGSILRNEANPGSPGSRLHSSCETKPISGSDCRLHFTERSQSGAPGLTSTVF